MRIITAARKKPTCCRDCRHLCHDPGAPLAYTCRAIAYQGKLPPSRTVFTVNLPDCEKYVPR
ncbi:MAG: hypothetical protein ACLFPD_02935 [Desulfosudaceae bacterium]